jgi:hypothetical protein
MYSFIIKELNIKLNIDKIKEKNEELLKKNLYKNLDKKEKYIIERYKGPPHGIDKFGLKGYIDFSDYFINQKEFTNINIKEIPVYTTIFGLNDHYNTFHINQHNFQEKITYILTTINDKRIENMEKYISIMDNIINKGIKNNNNTIYRVMSKNFDSNIIKNFTSWSLYPQIWFGAGSDVFHIYIAKLSPKIKSFYVEYDGDDKELTDIKKFPYYEYEFILPRNIEFTQKKISIKKIKPIMFEEKMKSNVKEQIVHIHYINIFKQHKNIKNIKNIKNMMTEKPVLSI